MNIKEMEKIRQRAHESFIRFEGVLGIGYGPKHVKGKQTQATAVVIFVEKKLPEDKVKKGEVIPRIFSDFPTDVEEVRFDQERDAKDGTGLYEGKPMAQFLDWGKIHRLNLERRKREGGQTESPKKGEDASMYDNPPTTELRGNLFIIEDHGTLTYTTAGGQKMIDLVAAWQLFRGQLGDDYDFATFFLDNTDSTFPYMGNFSQTIFHDASESGFGVPAVNNRATWNNSNRLLRSICHSWYSLRTMLHEAGHQWLFFVNYRNSAAGAEQTLLHEGWDSNWDAGQKWFHPGTWPDNDRSCMGYAHRDWIEISSGTPGIYRSLDLQWLDASLTMTGPDANFNFSPLDQYLMGLVNSEAVASSHVDPLAYLAADYQIINNATQRPDGDYDSTPVTITPQNIIWNEGARIPDHHNSPRVYHQAVLAITYDRTKFAQFLTDSNTRRGNQAINWRRATTGRSVMDTSLLRTNITDIYIRDNTSDAGGAFPGGDFWNSPDIFVRTQDDDPNLYLDPAIPNDTIHQKAKSNQNNWIYARISNKSATAYNNVTVNFYLANYKGFSGRDTASEAIPRTEVIYPIDWHPDSLIGSAELATVPAGGTAVAKILWPQSLIPPQADWHPCLLVEILPLDITPVKLHNVWDNKKLAQKNIEIEYISSDMKEIEFPFLIGHLETVSAFAYVEISRPNDAALKIYLDPGESLSELREIGGKLYHRIEGLASLKGAHQIAEEEKLLVNIPGNTTIGVGTGHNATDAHTILEVTFCKDTPLLVGSHAVDYHMLGYLPLEGFVAETLEEKRLLRVISSKACFPVSLRKVKSHEMRLKAGVDGDLDRPVTLHITQRNDNGKIVGGIDVQFRR